MVRVYEPPAVASSSMAEDIAEKRQPSISPPPRCKCELRQQRKRNEPSDEELQEDLVTQLRAKLRARA
jgi:hypothetical protein